MNTLAYSPAAQADIEYIWEHSAKHWGPNQADRYTDEIRDACHDLASARRLSRPVDTRPGYMKSATGTHMIYFRDHGD